MKRISRDIWLTIGLVILLSVITLAAALTQTQAAQTPPLATFSNHPDGGRALDLWLRSLSFSVIDQPGGVLFEVPAEASLILVLEPTEALDESHLDALNAWVEAGGTLILAGEGRWANYAMQEYDFYMYYLSSSPENRSQAAQTPLMTSPALTLPSQPACERWLYSERTDYVTHLAVGERPVLVSFAQGRGQVVLSAVTYPFSNQGLKDPGNPELVLNLLAVAPPGYPGRGQVWFDEWHHGLRSASREAVGVVQWLLHTPAGQSFLFVAAVIFITLVLQGRAFGRPIPLAREVQRRTPLEYITALANLSRRAGHRRDVLQQYHLRLKRDLGARYRLNPDLPDEAWVQALAQVRPGLPADQLAALLHSLSAGDASESEMIQLAREAAHWTEGKNR